MGAGSRDALSLLAEQGAEQPLSGSLSEAPGGGPGRLFHGGCPHLRPGQLVQPPLVTGVPVVPVNHKRTDLVYACQDAAVAAYFARVSTHGAGAPWREGAVYEVEPVGVVVPDPHAVDDASLIRQVELMLWQRSGRRGPAPRLSDGATFGMPAARVLRVVRTNLRMRRAEVDAHRQVADLLGHEWSVDRVAS